VVRVGAAVSSYSSRPITIMSCLYVGNAHLHVHIQEEEVGRRF